MSDLVFDLWQGRRDRPPRKEWWLLVLAWLAIMAIGYWAGGRI